MRRRIRLTGRGFTLLVLGLLTSVIERNAAALAVDALTLYMLRHAKPGHVMGIVLDGGFLNFVQVMAGEPE